MVSLTCQPGPDASTCDVTVMTPIYELFDASEIAALK
jgi:hypothetical protein